MDRDFDSNIDTSVRTEDTPETKWVAWAIWSSISLVVVLFGVLVAGIDSGLLLGWVVGIIIAAVLIVFRR